MPQVNVTLVDDLADPEREAIYSWLREFNVSVTDVVNALRMQNTTAPVGRVKGTLDEQSIRLVGRLETPKDFNGIVVRRRGDEVVRLGQVATIEDGFAELAGFSLRNGHPNVGLSVTRSPPTTEPRYIRPRVAVSATSVGPAGGCSMPGP